MVLRREDGVPLRLRTRDESGSRLVVAYASYVEKLL